MNRFPKTSKERMDKLINASTNHSWEFRKEAKEAVCAKCGICARCSYIDGHWYYPNREGFKYGKENANSCEHMSMNEALI